MLGIVEAQESKYTLSEVQVRREARRGEARRARVWRGCGTGAYPHTIAHRRMLPCSTGRWLAWLPVRLCTAVLRCCVAGAVWQE